MKKYMVYGLSICMAAVLLTGCGETVPDMTSEQQTQVTEYAVNTLLKYSKSNNSRLVLSELKNEEEIVEEPVEPEPEVIEEPEQPEPEPEEEAPEESTTEAGGGAEEPAYSSVPMDEFIGLQGASLAYRGCHVSDSYPEDSENAYFSMAASQGKKLLVLEFELKNQGNDAVAVDMNQIDASYAFTDNGGKKYKLQHTMAMNDIYAYSGTLEPGASEILAGIVELPEGEASQLTAPALAMTKGDEKVTIRLE